MCNDKKIEELEKRIRSLEKLTEDMMDSVFELELTSSMNALLNPEHCVSAGIDISEGCGEMCIICKKAIKNRDCMSVARFSDGHKVTVHEACLAEWEEQFGSPEN